MPGTSASRRATSLRLTLPAVGRGGHTYSSTSFSINSGKNGLARSVQMNLVRSRFGQKMDLVGNQRPSKTRISSDRTA
jgi:hypothetical protein